MGDNGDSGDESEYTYDTFRTEFSNIARIVSATVLKPTVGETSTFPFFDDSTLVGVCERTNTSRPAPMDGGFKTIPNEDAW